MPWQSRNWLKGKGTLLLPSLFVYLKRIIILATQVGPDKDLCAITHKIKLPADGGRAGQGIFNMNEKQSENQAFLDGLVQCSHFGILSWAVLFCSPFAKQVCLPAAKSPYVTHSFVPVQTAVKKQVPDNRSTQDASFTVSSPPPSLRSLYPLLSTWYWTTTKKSFGFMFFST